MQKRLILLVTILLIITAYPVYSLSLFPKDKNLISLNVINLKEVRYSNNITELVLESNSNYKIDGIIVNINNNDNIIVNNQLSPYSTNIYTINTKETPNIINIQFYNDINHNRNIINQVITYRITGNEENIIQQPQQILIQQENQQLQQEFNNNPSYISYSSYSKLDDNKNIIYFTKDTISSNRISTNQQGNIQFQANYQPYGKIFKEEGSENYKFSNKELDNSNLYYFGARYYDPYLGRFTQIDPIFKLQESPYLYANNNPIKYVDPTGKEPNKGDFILGGGVVSAGLTFYKGITNHWGLGTTLRNSAINFGIGSTQAALRMHIGMNGPSLIASETNYLLSSMSANTLLNRPLFSNIRLGFSPIYVDFSSSGTSWGIDVGQAIDVVNFAAIAYAVNGQIDWHTTWRSAAPAFSIPNAFQETFNGGSASGAAAGFGGGAMMYRGNIHRTSSIIAHEAVHLGQHRFEAGLAAGLLNYPKTRAGGINWDFSSLAGSLGNSLQSGMAYGIGREGTGIGPRDIFESNGDFYYSLWGEREAFVFARPVGPIHTPARTLILNPTP